MDNLPILVILGCEDIIIMMQPDQDSTPDPNRLEFIMQTELEKPKTWREKVLSKSGLALGAIIIVLISTVLILVSISTNKANSEQTERLISIAQSQTEIIRLSSLAESQAKDTSTKQRASEINSQMSVALDNFQSMLAERGVELDETSLSAKKNSQTDSAFIDSLQSGEFDETFNSTIDGTLVDYQQLLVEAQNYANESDKKTIDDAYNAVSEILGFQDQQQ